MEGASTDKAVVGWLWCSSRRFVLGAVARWPLMLYLSPSRTESGRWSQNQSQLIRTFLLQAGCWRRHNLQLINSAF